MIEILPENDGVVLGIRAMGSVTKEEYKLVFNPRVEIILEEHGKINTLCVPDQGLPRFLAGHPWAR